MHKSKTIVAALTLCAAIAAPAQADFKVGMADQDAAMFDSPAFQSLNIERVRYLVPFDWFKNRGTKSEVDLFMNRAQQDDIEVLVHFTARRGCYSNGRYSKRKVCKAPSVSTYKKNLRRFLKEHPETDTFGVWNEANHVSQPVAKNPKLAAKYFLAARSVCRGCSIVAADVLDQSNMRSWLQTFDRFDQGKARIFGLHNYVDVNRKRSSGTRELLDIVPGEVWLTETGGIYKFLPSFPSNASRQAKATKYMFSLARKYDSRQKGLRSRITRVYNYEWTGAESSARFDAGLTNPNGTPRKAYNTFKTLARSHDR